MAFRPGPGNPGVGFLVVARVAVVQFLSPAPALACVVV